MKIKSAKVEIWPFEGNEADHIAKCARVCYASEKNTNNKKFVQGLWYNNHKSMFRHVPVYLVIPRKLDNLNWNFVDANIVLFRDKYYISTNRQCALEYFYMYLMYEISAEEAEQNEIFYKNKLIRYTFCIDTGIDITRELNRKSPNNIAEQSTRYVDFNKKIGIVFKKCHWMFNLNLYKRLLVKLMCKTSEWFYKISRSKYGLNLKPQDARWILPLDTMSKAVYTYTVKDWERIINMRLYDWTGSAHPDAKIVAKQIKNELEQQGYKIVNYKDEKSKIGSL